MILTAVPRCHGHQRISILPASHLCPLTPCFDIPWNCQEYLARSFKVGIFAARHKTPFEALESVCHFHFLHENAPKLSAILVNTQHSYMLLSINVNNHKQAAVFRFVLSSDVTGVNSQSASVFKYDVNCCLEVFFLRIFTILRCLKHFLDTKTLTFYPSYQKTPC